MMIGKDIVAGKFGFVHRNQLVAIFQIMNTFDAKTTHFDEGRSKNRERQAIDAASFQAFVHNVGFQRKMTAQSGIAATHKNETIVEILVGFQNGLHGRARHFGGLGGGHGAGIGEHIKEIGLVLEGTLYIFFRPIGEQQAAMHGLYAGGIVVQGNHFETRCLE